MFCDTARIPSHSPQRFPRPIIIRGARAFVYNRPRYHANFGGLTSSDSSDSEPGIREARTSPHTPVHAPNTNTNPLRTPSRARTTGTQGRPSAANFQPSTPSRASANASAPGPNRSNLGPTHPVDQRRTTTTPIQLSFSIDLPQLSAGNSYRSRVTANVTRDSSAGVYTREGTPQTLVDALEESFDQFNFTNDEGEYDPQY